MLNGNESAVVVNLTEEQTALARKIVEESKSMGGTLIPMPIAPEVERLREENAVMYRMLIAIVDAKGGELKLSRARLEGVGPNDLLEFTHDHDNRQIIFRSRRG